jgi:hypothetical protein
MEVRFLAMESSYSGVVKREVEKVAVEELAKKKREGLEIVQKFNECHRGKEEAKRFKKIEKKRLKKKVKLMLEQL